MKTTWISRASFESDANEWHGKASCNMDVFVCGVGAERDPFPQTGRQKGPLPTNVNEMCSLIRAHDVKSMILWQIVSKF